MAAAMADEIVLPSHPYYPINIKLSGYIPNEHGVLELVSMFGAGCAVILAITLGISYLVSPQLKKCDRVAILWFTLTASIHLWFEGYFVVNHTRMPGMMDLFGQLWKEYSHADSRYLTSDSFVLCMESITMVLWGTFSYALVVLILRESPYRYPLQIVICTGQLYGDILYYMTNIFDEVYNGVTYCRPEAYYFWFYYFFMNWIWIMVPGYYLYDATKKVAASVRRLAQIDAGRKTK